MGDIAIRVENLGKQYRIGGKRARYRTLRESLIEAAWAPFRRLASVVCGRSSAETNETIWALKDVSFEVKPGEVVGVIGRNGAGKTTLLKILSRITEPTEGRAEIHGRVGSLLEVGTGFHPELTGRENIYLNGAILGMKRSEIERKFDEIVAFAEVEKFINTPVKHYSSGMYVRLAFAVAAHLEPEILLVDEVLAVGDAAFQKKCLGKMGDVAREGRTVLFVSHNLGAILNLCGSTILLDRGQVLRCGETQDIVDLYTSMCTSNKSDSVERLQALKVVKDIELLNGGGEPGGVISVGEPLTIDITLKDTARYSSIVVSLFICKMTGERLVMIGTRVQSALEIPKASDSVKLRARTSGLNLLPGKYRVDVGVGNAFELIDYVEGVTGFSVEYADYLGTGKLPSSRQGIIAHKATWRVIACDSQQSDSATSRQA